MRYVRVCDLANREHRRRKRHYAHVFHRPRQVCVATAFFSLPERVQLAILVHEFGHFLAGRSGSEQDANDALFKETRIRISYRDSRYGHQIETIPRAQIGRARALVEEQFQ